MKTATSFFLAGLFLSATAFADEWIVCKVRYETDNASKVFAPFDGGQLLLNTANGNASLSQTTSDGSKLTMVLVDDQTASSYKTDRKTCEYNPAVSHSPDGTLESFFIAFGSCHIPKPDGNGLKAVVSASEFYDAQGNRGLYQETYYDLGQPTQPYFWFSDCHPQ